MSVRRMGRLGVFICLIVLVIWCVGLEPPAVFSGSSQFLTVDDGWTQVIDGEAYGVALAQDAVVPEDGSAIVLERVISDKAKDRSLLFYASHQEVQVYIDDELQSSLTCPETLWFFSSPGREWMEIPINYHMIGQTLRLEFSSPFSIYHNVPDTFYYVQHSDIPSVQIDYMWLRNTMALALIALAVISYVNASIWKYAQLRRYLFSLADVYLFTGLWICGEINVLSAWVGNVTLSSLLAMVFLRVIPVVFHQFVYVSLNRLHTWWLKLLGVVAWGNLIVSLVLQFAFGVSLVSTLYGTMMVFGVSCVVYIVCILAHQLTHPSIHPEDKYHYAVLLYPVATLIEVYCCINQVYGERLTGVFISIGSLIYAGIAHVMLVRNESKTKESNEKLESQNRAMEKRPLNQQINAHFLFNTLNTISAYCKTAPETADQAVKLLAQYMRRYMRLVSADDYVPFQEEVTLIHHYLEILNLRYSEELVFQVDAQFDAFVLPPLTLQPLVENAVVHGIHTHVERGMVEVSAKRHGNMAEVIVADNGCGFDRDTMPSGNGVGLQNLTKRIQAMGGSMQVVSRVGQGTNVILRVPIQGDIEIR